MKTFNLIVSISDLVSPTFTDGDISPFNGTLRIEGECALVQEDEHGQFWEAQTIRWSVEDATDADGNTIPANGQELNGYLTGCERLMEELLAEVAESDPAYLAQVAERKAARQRVADLKSQLAEAEWILRNPPESRDPEGDAERRFLSRGDDAREARFDAEREPWGD